MTVLSASTAGLAMFSDEFVGKVFHHEAAVVFEINKLRQFEKALQGKAVELFPALAKNNWVDLHGTYMWHRRPDKSGWKTDWSTCTKLQIEEFFEYATALIGEHCQRIYIQPLRRKEAGGTFFDGHPRDWALVFLAQRLDGMCRYQGTSAFMFFDEEPNNKLSKARESKIHSYIANGAHGPYSKPITRVIQPALALNSTYSVGIQAADLVAYIYGRILSSANTNRPDTKQMTKYFEALGKVEILQKWPAK